MLSVITLQDGYHRCAKKKDALTVVSVVILWSHYRCYCFCVSIYIYL